MTNLTLVVLALIAHFGIRLAFYNRLNSLGLRRRTIKTIEKVAFAETLLTPVVIVWVWREAIAQFIDGTAEPLPPVVRWYGGCCLLIGGVLFTLWLRWRPMFKVEHADVRRTTQVHRATGRDKVRFARSKRCHAAARVPGNQVFDLAIERIDVPLRNLPRELEGYRIAHLSDIHLTGHFHPDYLNETIDHALAWQPEVFLLTGDIVDSQQCVSWVKKSFSRAIANDGGFFILGNHDMRVSDPQQVRYEMQSAGWTDVGGRVLSTTLRETRVMMMGNEWPWFSRPSDADIHRVSQQSEEVRFRLALSHSPDQFDWSRGQNVDLLLCGHTHGGQGRLPIVGPILSPSWHGSRWASGDFYRPPTTMHVSRGLGGVHLLRVHCRPELSLLTLRCSPTPGRSE